MPVSNNTTPTKIVDKNGKSTTVHRGSKSKMTNSDRSVAVTAPKKIVATLRGVSIGDSFSAPYGDGKIRYTVVSFRGDIAIAEADENEYGIKERPFSVDEISRVIDWERKFENAQSDTDEFWGNSKVGDIVHYDSGHGGFIRAEVVIIDDVKKIRPIALVGDWGYGDTPRRLSNGEIEYGYHVRSIMEGNTFAPNPSSIWEAMGEEKRNAPRYASLGISDPTLLAPIDTTVPPMTDAESKSARIEKLLQGIPEVLNTYNSTPEEKLFAVKSIITEIEGAY